MSSTSSRSNLGMYFAQDNQAGDGQTGKVPGGATTGNCYRDIVPPGHPSLNAFCTAANTPFSFCTGNGTGTSTQTLGSNHYTELDNPNLAPTPDNCGDGNSGSSQLVDVLVRGVLCEPTSITDAHLRLPNCISWQVPGQTIQCISPSPTFPWVPAAVPGTGSKCNCGVLSVPIIVQRAAISVTKSANPTTIPNGTDGGTSTYTVTVTNTSNLGSVTVNQLCDDKYGAIAGGAGNTCAKGALCQGGAGTTCASNITCSPSIPATLANPNDSVTCTFNGFIPENTVLTDTVTANAVDQQGNPLTGSAQATVTTGDAPASAQLTKTSSGATHGCATIRYNLTVHNSSNASQTTDENESLTGLTDSAFNSITSLNGDDHTNNSVVGTTCGVANNAQGLGTLGGVLGGGALPFSLPAVGTPDYTCKFDGVICGNLTTVTKPDQTTCIGLQHSNAIMAALLDDDLEGNVVSQSGGTLNVTECFDTF